MPERHYGMKRYITTVDRFAAPLDAIVDNSSDVEFDTTKQSVKRRNGHSILGDTWGGTPKGPVSGLLESSWGAVPRQIVSIKSPSMDDGYPAYACLFTDETDREGQLYVRSTDSSGANYVLGKEYGSTHYTPDGAGTGEFHVLPLRSFNATDKLTRLNSATLRKLIGAGARRGLLEAGNWLYMQGETPLMWNKRWNDSTSAGTEVNRVRPWGHPIPLIMPSISSANYPTASTSVKPWHEGDRFFVSVMFKFEDGSYSMPMLPREINGFLTSGLGLITVASTTGSDDYYDFMPWRDIPLGPKGTIARILLRTFKQDSTSTDAPVLSKLFICGVINDNVSTEYDDPLGNDDGLIDDPELVRFDHQWPHRAQCVVANEERVMVGGKIKPNPAAIILAPTGVSTSRELNVDEDTSVAFGAVDRFFVQIVLGGILKLKWVEHTGGTENVKNISVASPTITLQDVCDQINALTVSDTAKEWVAQVAPGTDPQTPSTYLLATDSEDVGDDSVADLTGTGNIRAFCPAFPAVLYLNDSWEGEQNEDAQEIRFTGASPGHPPAATNNFYEGNRRRPPTLLEGPFVGAAPLLDKFVVCYEKAIYVLRNIKGGSSGLDEDYHLVPLNATRGCIAWDSIAYGDGWVCYLTRDGLVVTDGEREAVISGDVYKPGGGSTAGDWADEVEACAASTASGGDDARFHAMVAQGALWVSYREVDSSVESAKMKYDYSANQLASGLSEVLDSNGLPFGWSPPHVGMAPGPMGKVEKSDGLWLLSAHMVNAGTNDGGIVRFDTGDTDFGSAIGCAVQGPTDTMDTIRKVEFKRLWMIRTKNGTGMFLYFYRDKELATQFSFTLPTTGTTLYGRDRIELPLNARGNADAGTWFINDPGSSSNPMEVLALIAEYEETMSEV